MISRQQEPNQDNSDGTAVSECLTHSIAETAALIGVGYHTVFRLLKRKKLRALPSIRHKRIPRAEIDRFLREI